MINHQWNLDFVGSVVIIGSTLNNLLQTPLRQPTLRKHRFHLHHPISDYPLIWITSLSPGRYVENDSHQTGRNFNCRKPLLDLVLENGNPVQYVPRIQINGIKSAAKFEPSQFESFPSSSSSLLWSTRASQLT